MPNRNLTRLIELLKILKFVIRNEQGKDEGTTTKHTTALLVNMLMSSSVIVVSRNKQGTDSWEQR